MSDKQEGFDLQDLFIKELKRRLSDPEIAKTMAAAELNVVRQVLADNSITLASAKSGSFGKLAKDVAEEFPFDDEGRRAN